MNLRLAIWLAVFLVLAAARAEADIRGNWVLADGSAVVSIEDRGSMLAARIVGWPRPRLSPIDKHVQVGSPRRDLLNPERALRQRPLLGLEIAFDLSPDGAGWKGRIYDPTSGRTYNCRVESLGDEYLEVRGYLGFSALGRSMYWQRLESYRAQVSAMLQLRGE